MEYSGNGNRTPGGHSDGSSIAEWRLSDEREWAGLSRSWGAGGIHRIEIVFDLRQLLLLGITMVLFLIARLLERARELETEVREFV